MYMFYGTYCRQKLHKLYTAQYFESVLHVAKWLSFIEDKIQENIPEGNI